MKQIEKNQRTLIREQLKRTDWHVFATLTFRGVVTEQSAYATVKHFFQLVDFKLYGHASVRYNKRIQRMCFIEGSELGARWHFHCLIQKPTIVLKAMKNL